MRKFLLILFLVFCQISFAQELNAYKYVIVPVKYEFLKEPNQYRLGELTKFLFEKEGIQAYLEGEVPRDLAKNSCNVLHSNILEDSGLFVTKLKLELRDCNNKIIFTTKEGTSRVKDFKKAYHEALRNAFESITAQDYNYQENEKNVVEVTAIPQKESGVKGEVVKSVPEPQEEKGADNLVTVGTSSLTGEHVFVRDNAVYYLSKTSTGYNFFQKEMAEPFAALVKSSTGNSFIYSSVTSKGVASFNEAGDLIVEILDPSTGALKTTVYRKQVQ